MHACTLGSRTTYHILLNFSSYFIQSHALHVYRNVHDEVNPSRASLSILQFFLALLVFVDAISLAMAISRAYGGGG